MCSIDHKNNEM